MADKENLHKDHRQRMMKKYTENGINCFEPHEILEILLYNVFPRCNTNDISHRLLNEFKTIKGVLNATASDLAAIDGIGENAAARICFLGDLFGYLATETSEQVVLDTNERVFELCKGLENISTKEFFVLLFLDKKQTLLTKYFVKGQFNIVSLIKRDIALKAVYSGCSGAVAVHNHFGEFSRPSSADVIGTESLRKFLKDLNVDLYDHLIIHDGTYLSMRTYEASSRIWL